MSSMGEEQRDQFAKWAEMWLAGQEQFDYSDELTHRPLGDDLGTP